jgi:hypothetical protein
VFPFSSTDGGGLVNEDLNLLWCILWISLHPPKNFLLSLQVETLLKERLKLKDDKKISFVDNRYTDHFKS